MKRGILLAMLVVLLFAGCTYSRWNVDSVKIRAGVNYGKAEEAATANWTIHERDTERRSWSVHTGLEILLCPGRRNHGKENSKTAKDL